VHEVFDPRRALSGRHLVVTGVTGFLGKVWLSWLLHELPEIGRVTLIVRPRPGQQPAERFAEIADTNPCLRPLKRRWGPDYADFLRERVEVVRGNVERPLLGLGPAVVQRLAGRVDAVVHFAGLTDFEAAPEKAVAVNTLGAGHAADLAARLGARLVHCSTAYVAGCRDGVVAETWPDGRSPNGTPVDVPAELAALEEATRLPHLDGRALKEARVRVAVARAEALGWPNVYTYTKGLAELLLAARADVDVTIVRPAILECAVAYPFEGWNEGLNTSGPLSWLIATGFRHLPARPEHRFDVVPIDIAARGFNLALAAALVGRAPRVLHIASSEDNPLTFGRTIELNGLAMRRYRRQNPADGLAGWLHHLDPVPAPDGGPVPVSRLRRWADRLKGIAEDLSDDGLVGTVAQRAAERLGRADRDLARVEDMLRLYRPFIHQHDYVFRTGALRALNAALSDEDRERLGYDVSGVDWRRYWVDVEVPGLRKWSIPLLDGEQAPLDPPSDPPLSLSAPVAEQAVSR
jgi:long-chain acyl-CoA synthetase